MKVPFYLVLPQLFLLLPLIGNCDASTTTQSTTGGKIDRVYNETTLAIVPPRISPKQLSANADDAAALKSLTQNSTSQETQTVRSGNNTEVKDLMTGLEPSPIVPKQVLPDTAAPLKPFQEASANSSRIDTEVADLLMENRNNGSSSAASFDLPIPVEQDPSINEEDLFKKDDTELWENGDNTEDKLLVTSERVQLVKNESTHSNKNLHSGYPLFGGQLAAILAGGFLLLSIVGYLAMMSWRKRLEMVYGSRTMLVNEEDFDDLDDIKHFSI